MSKYCLSGKLATEFKSRLKSGEIDPEALAKMSSEKRRAFFEGFLDSTNAKNVNALFEKKLLAKRRWDAMIKWAQEVSGIKPEVRRDLVSKIEKMIQYKDGNLLAPQEEEAFLKDLVSTKLGTDVTYEEAGKIAEFSKKVSESRRELESKPDDKNSRIRFGNALLDMYEYVESLNKKEMSFTDVLSNIANVPRAIISSIDFSAPFRQGFGMVTNKRFWENLKPMFQAAFKEQAYKDIQAEILARPTYNVMQKSGLRIVSLGRNLSQREEAYMTTLLDKVPGIRGSERAYTAFLSKLRADAFDDLLRKGQLAGEDVSAGSKFTKDIANVVNTFTGTGKIGKVDQVAPILNSVFFSPRKIASTIQKLNPKNYLSRDISPIARQEALKRLAGQVGFSTAVLYLATLFGAKTETDPRSSDFGKIQVGNSRIDVTGGDGNYAVLLSRLITNQMKSTTSDIIKSLGEGFGAKTRGDIAVQFLRNKLSPTASFIASWLYGTDPSGNPFNLKSEAISLITPISISTVLESLKNDPNMAFTNTIFDLFGFSVNVYSMKTDWNTFTSKEMLQFKEKVSPEEFQEANDEYNQKINELVPKIIEDSRYKKLSEEEKTTVLLKLREKTKNDILKKHKFIYRRTPTQVNPAIKQLVK